MGRQWGWLRDHQGHLTWVLMTGHLLVLRIQWPWRPSFFPKLHVWVPVGRVQDRKTEITSVEQNRELSKAGSHPAVRSLHQDSGGSAAAPDSRERVQPLSQTPALLHLAGNRQNNSMTQFPPGQGGGQRCMGFQHNHADLTLAGRGPSAFTATTPNQRTP